MASQVLPFGLLADDLEDLFEPLNLAFGLPLVLLEGRPQLIGVRGLRHLRQSSEDFLFREVDVLERIVKQILQCLLFRHGVLRLAA